MVADGTESDRSPTRPFTVVRRVLMALAVGLVSFLISSLTAESLVWTVTLATFIGGIVLVVEILVDVERQLGMTTASVIERGQEARKLLEQKDGDADAVSLVVKYFEEKIPQIIIDSLEPGQKEEPLVRELVHSLNTPLAQMEATLLAMEESATVGRAELSSLLSGVEVCKSFLISFREIATLSRDSQAWAPASLNTSIAAASEMYIKKVEGDPTVSVDLPDSLPGYDNNYLAAVLLPLLENAIEATSSAGCVRVGMTPTDVWYILTVFNTLDGPYPIAPDIFEHRSTTKSGHDGLGLSTVRFLLSVHDGADVSVEPADGSVLFSVRLPRGKD